MKVHFGGRLFLAAAMLGAVALMTAGFFAALAIRSALADPGGPVPDPGHAWTELQDHGADAGDGNDYWLGTTDNNALELWVNNARALRLEPSGGRPNVIGGYSGNAVIDNAGGATIAGGGEAGVPNRVSDQSGTVGGGIANIAGSDDGDNGSAEFATVGGGAANGASGEYATVGGGLGNQASDQHATVGGGNNNAASAQNATVGGGANNASSALACTIGGGDDNGAYGDYATVGGGYSNAAGGLSATIAGGNDNNASHPYATVGGGQNNAASDDWATVAGGTNNNASALGATIAGGAGNTANNGGAAICGGENNTASGAYSSVGGGYGNEAAASYTTIAGGGYGNQATDDYCTIGGGGNNQAGDPGTAADQETYATVGGGFDNEAAASYATIAGGYANNVYGEYGTVGGGGQNYAGAFEAPLEQQPYNTVGGGYRNEATGSFYDVIEEQWHGHATVGGGEENIADAAWSTVAGGEDNWASDEHATIGGGYHNNAFGRGATVSGGFENNNAFLAGEGSAVGGGAWNDASATYSTVPGGFDNDATGSYSTIPGGSGNTAAGDYSFAAGRRANAQNDGCWVWADSTNADYNCLADNKFMARASGGVVFHVSSDLTDWVRIYDDGSDLIATSSGGHLTSGGNWVNNSDAATKENFTPVDGQAVLASVAELPISTWSYKAEDPSVTHMGPTAQDFSAAFGLGEGDTSIGTIDADGVALAAIQGLYEIVQGLEAENVSLQQRVDDLDARVTALEGGAPLERDSAGPFASIMPGGWLLLIGLLALGGLGVLAQRRLAGGRS
jgi:hypothetical protein